MATATHPRTDGATPWFSLTAEVFTPWTFDSKQMNVAAIGEIVLAVLVTQMDAFQRMFGTTALNSQQFGWPLLTPVALLLLWQAGKVVARRAEAS